MNRRRLLATTAAAAVTGPALAQKVPRVGILFAADPEPSMGLLRKSMSALGYVEGRSVVYEVRAAGGTGGDLAVLARALVDSKVDVIVPVLAPAIAAVRPLTSTIPAFTVS